MEVCKAMLDESKDKERQRLFSNQMVLRQPKLLLGNCNKKPSKPSHYRYFGLQNKVRELGPVLENSTKGCIEIIKKKKIKMNAPIPSIDRLFCVIDNLFFFSDCLPKNQQLLTL